MKTQKYEKSNGEITHELSNLYAQMIVGSNLTLDDQNAWDIIDQAWERVPEVEVSQGDLTGIIKREDVSYFLGSLAGYSIHVDLQTPEGKKNIPLRLNGKTPAFSFKPIEIGSKLSIEPVRPDYREVGIAEGFDWVTIIDDVNKFNDLEPGIPLYLVVFRSQLIEGADTQSLLEHDHRAHQAALESPALLHYFADTPDHTGRALSFCLWSDKAEAQAISKDRRHREATAMINMYESYSLEKYDLHIARDHLRFTPVDERYSHI